MAGLLNLQTRLSTDCVIADTVPKAAQVSAFLQNLHNYQLCESTQRKTSRHYTSHLLRTRAALSNAAAYAHLKSSL